jgi:uncharacterized membrane protein YjfL (UPF0719 family)
MFMNGTIMSVSKAVCNWLDNTSLKMICIEGSVCGFILPFIAHIFISDMMTRFVLYGGITVIIGIVLFGSTYLDDKYKDIKKIDIIKKDLQ